MPLENKLHERVRVTLYKLCNFCFLINPSRTLPFIRDAPKMKTKKKKSLVLFIRGFVSCNLLSRHRRFLLLTNFQRRNSVVNVDLRWCCRRRREHGEEPPVPRREPCLLPATVAEIQRRTGTWGGAEVNVVREQTRFIFRLLCFFEWNNVWCLQLVSVFGAHHATCSRPILSGKVIQCLSIFKWCVLFCFQ